jgi:hypothetical protein
VTDFGFARILTASSEEERARRQMTHCGTEVRISKHGRRVTDDVVVHESGDG